MKLDKVYLVIAGSFGAGKTEGVRDMYSFLDSRHQHYDPAISDATYILEALGEDHKKNRGINHMHEGQRFPQPHDHRPGEKDLQFAVTGNFVPHYMYNNFFRRLSREVPSDRFQIVEWSGGRNIHPPDHPAVNADYSFRTQVQDLWSGSYERGWLSHVALMIHPVTDFDQRLVFNQRRSDRDPTPDEIARGTRSWGIPLDGMKLTGNDDFLEVVPDLERMGLAGRIHPISNNGDGTYTAELSRILTEVIDPMINFEGQINKDGSGSSTTQRGMR